jgi:hypothetical protein
MRIGTTVRSPQGTIEVSVLADGQALPLYRRPSDGAVFTAGVRGQAYALHVRNLTSGRAEVINTVDGRHTLKDEPGDAERNRGLVFAAESAGDFTGWRLNDAETRQFVFGAPDRSVAVQATGSAANTGVIGFAAYREYVNYGLHHAPVAFASAAATCGGSQARGLGTGMGERQSDHVTSTSFTRVPGAPDILVIGYDTESALEAMGITGPAEPSAFPGAGTGYERYQPVP